MVVWSFIGICAAENAPQGQDTSVTKYQDKKKKCKKYICYFFFLSGEQLEPRSIQPGQGASQHNAFPAVPYGHAPLYSSCLHIFLYHTDDSKS